MTFRDLLHEAVLALTANKVRTGLTMLGIVIGIGSVIAMLSVGQGAQNSVQSSIQSIGSNLIVVRPGAQRGPGVSPSAGRGSSQSLKVSDYEAIQSEITGVKAVAPELTSRYQIVAKGTNTNTQIIGTVPAYAEVRNLQVDTGSFITDANMKDLARVAVLGPTTRDDLFGVNADAVGQTIRINGMSFTVIGITKAKGGSGFGSQDDIVIIPLTVSEQFLSNGDYVSNINIEAVDQQSMTQVQSDVTDLLLARHKIKDVASADFSTLNQADIVATASSVTGIFTILLASVAGISLVVGGIGIMNMMLTTVTERTREIGLRKAVGARKKDINRQFLFESICMTSIGGILGIIMGYLVSFGISATGLLTTQTSSTSVLLSFGVSACIGIVFGYYPAKRAANLNPIDALRYE
ncbi:MAG: ABC transporter permease [Candidatus Taylorbacteria bacterium]|nr:ABC transporter permease [Candidatus Taylorbacteria bacterium]